MITTDALRAVRLELATAAPLPANKNERALIDDLEFVPAADMNDLGGASLLIGVRDNDLKGRDSGDVSQLALVHGDPSAQREHCLRGAHDEEPGGTESAVLDCRTFILERVGQALDGLDTQGDPDPTARTTLPLYLALRGGVDASLPTYYVRIGQALHAVEDSFTHTYRTPDGSHITVALDWVDEANGDLVEANDGPPHSTELDRCDDPDPLRRQRRALATEAATAVLRATLDPNQTPPQKMATMEVILDKYLRYAPGCTFDNGWCNAPEHALGNGGSGCAVGGPAEHEEAGWSVMALAVLTLAARRRRHRAGLALVVIALVDLTSHEASARAAAPAPDATADAGTPPPVTPVKEPGPADPNEVAIGAYLGGSASVSHSAVAGAVGARLRVSKHWTLGADAEWNPWIAVGGKTEARAGAFNGYGTLILRLPLAYEKFNLRVTGNLGVSRLLIDLYGAPKGSTGLFVGFSPLGLEWKMSKMFYLVLNPLNVAVPVPQMKGVPFSYPQYRATIGLELYAG